MSLDTTPTLPGHRWNGHPPRGNPWGPAASAVPRPWPVSPPPPPPLTPNHWAPTPLPVQPGAVPAPGWPPPPAPPRGTSARNWVLLGAGTLVVVLLALVALVSASAGESHQQAGAAAHGAPTSAAPSSPSSAPTATSLAPIVPNEALPGLLLDPGAINAVMGTRDLAVNPDLTTTKLYIDTTDRPQCGGVWANANKTVYAGSGWDAVQTQYLSEPTNPQHEIFQSVVSFPTAAKAADFVAKEAKSWPLCNGKAITTTTRDYPPQIWWVSTVNQHDGMLTALSTREGARGWGCQHALTARNNVVIDVEACGVDVMQQGVAIATKVADQVH
ncbi:sensor domain-containing protein [Mycobacterium simiae]|nr:sensor domain-containing protein [Mycobacterium simiae]